MQLWKDFFESVRAREHNYNSKDDIQAQNAINCSNFKQNNSERKKDYHLRFSSRIYSVKKNTIQSRLGRYPELSTLWEQARAECDVNYSPKEDEIKEQSEKLKKF